MKLTVIATVLLSTIVMAQALQSEKSVLVKDVDDFSKSFTEKNSFCGLVNPCAKVSDISKSSVVLTLQKELESLRNNNTQLVNELKIISAHTEASSQQNVYADYKSIADMKPVFWLSGTYFDGLREGVSLSRSGLAPLVDTLGNRVTRDRDVPVGPVRGRMAYKFDRTNSIISTTEVNKKFTFFLVYNMPVLQDDNVQGRFFTSPKGNKLFGGWYRNARRLYIEGWILEDYVQTTDTVILALTCNEDNIKNVWTHDRQLVLYARSGTNDWGQVVVGRPKIFEIEAASVNVYEALVFDRALGVDQIQSVLAVFKRMYSLE